MSNSEHNLFASKSQMIRQRIKIKINYECLMDLKLFKIFDYIHYDYYFFVCLMVLKNCRLTLMMIIDTLQQWASKPTSYSFDQNFADTFNQKCQFCKIWYDQKYIILKRGKLCPFHDFFSLLQGRKAKSSPPCSFLVTNLLQKNTISSENFWDTLSYMILHNSIISKHK